MISWLLEHQWKNSNYWQKFDYFPLTEEIEKNPKAAEFKKLSL